MPRLSSPAQPPAPVIAPSSAANAISFQSTASMPRLQRAKSCERLPTRLPRVNAGTASTAIGWSGNRGGCLIRWHNHERFAIELAAAAGEIEHLAKDVAKGYAF